MAKMWKRPMGTGIAWRRARENGIAIIVGQRLVVSNRGRSEFTTSYIQDSLSMFRITRNLTERSRRKVWDEKPYASAGSEMNSASQCW